MQTITIEALSAASLARQIDALDHETRAQIVATENGAPWAYLDVSPMTDTRRSVFPNYEGNFRGDMRKAGQSGVHFVTGAGSHELSVVINRAARMARA